MSKKFSGVYLKISPWFVLIILGTISWSLTMVKSGIRYPFGIGFWGPNGHDGVWHIALSESFARGSWENPAFAGEVIKNYHVGYDLLLAAINKITQIPISVLYFQVLPPLFAVLIGFFVYKFVLTLTKSHSQAFWATFFVYFGGGFGWLITLFRDFRIDGESLFWSQQSISTLINPPFALSLIFLLSGLSVLVEGVRTNNSKKLVLATFLFGILTQIKIYAAILIIPALLFAGIIQLIRGKGVSLIKVAAGALILAILLFSPSKTDIGSTIIFRPFWFLEQLMATPDRLYWPKYAEAMINYVLGANWVKAFLAYGFAFLIFIIGNFGTRILFFIYLIKKGVDFKNYSYIEITLIGITAAGVAVPLLFVQSGTNWNTIQFFYYSLVFSGIFSGIVFSKLIKNPTKETYIYSALLILLTIPTTIGTLTNHYLPSRPPAMISDKELEALNYLSDKPLGVVLTQPYSALKHDSLDTIPPRPLYFYESTAYVSAYSNKPSYFEDQVNLEITGYNWKERQKEAVRFFTDETFDGKYELLGKKDIRYVYVVNSLQQNHKKLHLEPDMIFRNSEVTIFEVK